MLRASCCRLGRAWPAVTQAHKPAVNFPLLSCRALSTGTDNRKNEHFPTAKSSAVKSKESQGMAGTAAKSIVAAWKGTADFFMHPQLIPKKMNEAWIGIKDVAQHYWVLLLRCIAYLLFYNLNKISGWFKTALGRHQGRQHHNEACFERF